MKNSWFLFLCLGILYLMPQDLLAQNTIIKDFTVKENLSQNGKLAIIAIDTAEKTDNTINGNYNFTINGFSQELKFTDGVAVTSNPIESSTFVFFKHKFAGSDLGKLFFLRVTDKGITPYKISGFLLIIIPLLILYIAYKFKRFLITLLILAAIYFYLNYSKGLDVRQLIESSIMGLKGLL
ncbi:hypothetical protein [Sphingobacterium sp. BS-2]|uniref:hypothetical protein n=1 Tax=Sphingobacterium sp. BS-2 TaxID=3377129 RepID=UPI0038FD0CEC